MEDFLFRPVNDEQTKAIKAFKDNDILFLLGPAGSGKTHVALALAAQQVLSGEAERIVLTRPVVAAGGENLGYLPGKLEAKMHPWLLPLHDVLRRMTFVKPEQWVKEHCEIVPLGYMRGRTFDRAVSILDEAQNATLSQLRLFLTRIGHKGKLILSGDEQQSDISSPALAAVTDRLTSLSGVAVCNLHSIINPRHPLISRILDRLK